jgi:hypothetical protein
MAEIEKIGPRRIRRVDQKLQFLIKKNQSARQLSDQVAGTSEETANLFSSGTTPTVRMTLEDRECGVRRRE